MTFSRRDTGRVTSKKERHRHGDLKQERIRQDRQRTGEGDSKHYKQVSHGATLIFDDFFL